MADELPDYANMPDGELLRTVGVDAKRWTDAFKARAVKAGFVVDLPDDLLRFWFANAIEHATQVQKDSAKPKPRPELFAPGQKVIAKRARKSNFRVIRYVADSDMWEVMGNDKTTRHFWGHELEPAPDTVGVGDAAAENRRV